MDEKLLINLILLLLLFYNLILGQVRNREGLDFKLGGGEFQEREWGKKILEQA